MSAPYLGDIRENATIYFMWSSNDGDGASVTRTADGTISVYKDDNVAQSVAGITDTEDFDGLTGIHSVKIDTNADAFYATGSDYAVVLSAATIDGKTVNAVLAHFSIENRPQLRPVTDQRELVIDASNRAYADLRTWGGAAPGALINGRVQTDVIAVSSDTAAAINLEADYDGTGYDKANSKIGEATALGANAVSAAALATAAAQEIADEIMRMTTATVEGAGGGTPSSRTLYGVIAALMHLHERDAGDNNIVLYESDDATPLVTIPITKGPSLEPIRKMDPPA